jgi:hypothetical protein
VLNVLFQVLALLLELAGQVTVILIFLFELLLDVYLVKTDDLLFKFLEVTNRVKTFMNIVFKLFNFALLLLENRS